MKKNAPAAPCAFLGLLLLALAAPLFPQGHPRGAILDEARYNSLPRKAAQISRGIDSLPRSASLKQYAPSPGDSTGPAPPGPPHTPPGPSPNQRR
ncbi:MAG: hypothetical protein LBD55_02310 [Treponema sp.]|jgi:hypothetical protein|nr:hypothetical protein [Treponema sp.]